MIAFGLRPGGGTTPARAGRLPSRRRRQKSGGPASCRPAVFHSQRLALDAVLCGGLIRERGARLRIRHRLARPLPRRPPRCGCAAPPAPLSPGCGIEGIPAAAKLRPAAFAAERGRAASCRWRSRRRPPAARHPAGCRAAASCRRGRPVAPPRRGSASGRGKKVLPGGRRPGVGLRIADQTTQTCPAPDAGQASLSPSSPVP